MRNCISGKLCWMVVICFCFAMAFGATASADDETPFYEKSLHYSARGMINAYEREDGLMWISKTPYDFEKLDCLQCHVKTCDVCHAVQKDEKLSYSANKAKEMDTCMKCHGKEGLVFHMGKQMGTLDVHVAQGMICVDCHSGEDIHGDGTVYASMREPGAVKASCKNCHELNTEIRAHALHAETVDCSTCHVLTSVSCMNCHFDTFKKTGNRDGIFFILNSYQLLMNRDSDGKVAGGTAMSFVADNQKFVVYSPQFTHAIQKKGKACGDCHANEALKLIASGETVPMMQYSDGKMESWQGVVPAVHEQLKWEYFNREGDKWVPLETEADAKVQWWYAKPLSEEQLKKLAQPAEVAQPAAEVEEGTTTDNSKTE